jgi:hypothetical protein
VPLESVLPPEQGLYLFLGVGDWSPLLAAGYDEGAILVEFNDDNEPVAAYQRPDVQAN